MVDITGLDKAAVLQALFNRSKQQGMGFMDTRGAIPMTLEDARQFISSEGCEYDYLRGRVMKINISKNTFDPWGFDRDNGAGAAEAAIKPLRNASR